MLVAQKEKGKENDIVVKVCRCLQKNKTKQNYNKNTVEGKTNVTISVSRSYKNWVYGVFVCDQVRTGKQANKLMNLLLFVWKTVIRTKNVSRNFHRLSIKF